MSAKRSEKTGRPKSAAADTAPPIVGIGASAGGLEAFEAFLKAMPGDSGMAFVLVPHLDPNHVSLLPELLQRHTKMKVAQVEDGVRVRANGVYVIPPNRDLAVLNGALRLMVPSRSEGARFMAELG